MDDGCFDYNEMFRKSETMLTNAFTTVNRRQISALLGLESTILITLTLKQNILSSKHPYLIIGCMTVHLFDGCGFVSYGSTRKGNFTVSYDTRADNESFEGRGLFKAMVLMASEICFAGTGSRMLFVQARKGERPEQLFKSMCFIPTEDDNERISTSKIKEVMEKITDKQDKLGVDFILPEENLVTLVIERKPYLGFNLLPERLVTGLGLEHIADEDNDEPPASSGEIRAPDLPNLEPPLVGRRSPRIIEQRVSNMSNQISRRITCRKTEFSGVKFSASVNKWYGWFGKTVYEEIEVSYVMRNFSSSLVRECLNTPEKVCKIPASAPKLSQPSVHVNLSTWKIPVYQQLGKDSCMFSAASSAFNYFGDPMAHELLTKNIISSMSVSNRLDALTSLLYNKQCRYNAKKYKRGTFNVLEDISCFPTVLVLEGSDGAINHSVTVAGCWLFDSNTRYAQRISLPILDWCCSTDFAKVQFSNVFSATRFKHRKPRKEWKLCDNCRNGCKLPCLTRHILA
jgi:hypothetical protein